MATDPSIPSSSGTGLNFDGGEIYSGRGNDARTGGTWRAEGGGSGRLAPLAEILSGEKGLGDPDKSGRPRAGSHRPAKP